MPEQAGQWSFETFLGTSKVGVVLVHEIFGLDDYARSVGKQLSQSGFSVAVVDLYKGRYAKTMEEAREIRSALKREDILDAFANGVKLLRGKLGGEARLGSMGFCMGGGFALLGASNLGLDFCVDYYGMMENSDDVKGVKGPVLLILASEDPRITPWAFQSFLPAAATHKKRVDVQLYPNVGHAFHRPGWQGHNEDAARDAWKRTVEFLSALK